MLNLSIDKDDLISLQYLLSEVSFFLLNLLLKRLFSAIGTDQLVVCPL